MDRVGENISGTISYTAKKIPILKLWKLYIPELTRFMTLDSHLHTDETLVALLYCAWYGLGRARIEGLRVDSLYWAPSASARSWPPSPASPPPASNSPNSNSTAQKSP